MAFTIGIDYGSNSVRAIVVDCSNGLGSSVVNYPSGENGILLDPGDHNLARQHPGDYLFGLERSVRGALEQASGDAGFSADKVIGIGVDTTGSSPLPVDEHNVPLGLHKKWKDNLDAQCWLWKDHTSYREAARITETAAMHRPHYIAKCGNTYSSEWWWSKIWHCLNVAPEVFDEAFSWVELADYIPSVLVGVQDPLAIKRGICAAGHKAFYSDEWGGLPDKEFLSLLDPKLVDLRERLYDEAYDATTSAGTLCPEWAQKLDLPEGIPVAIGEFDVHYGAIGSGVDEGVFVKAIGTSTCDCCVVHSDKPIADIPGICGIVKGAILPGYYGIEAGQSAVGDLFKWWVEVVCEGQNALPHYPDLSTRPSNCTASCTLTSAAQMIGRSNSRAPRSTRLNSAGCSMNCRTKWNAPATDRDASNSSPHIESGNQVLNKHGASLKSEVLRQNLPQAKSDSSRSMRGRFLPLTCRNPVTIIWPHTAL
jgi:L-ribulokinase